jgi:hypothetical protein
MKLQATGLSSNEFTFRSDSLDRAVRVLIDADGFLSTKGPDGSQIELSDGLATDLLADTSIGQFIRARDWPVEATDEEE